MVQPCASLVCWRVVWDRRGWWIPPCGGTINWWFGGMQIFVVEFYHIIIIGGEGTNGMDPNQAGSTQSTLG